MDFHEKLQMLRKQKGLTQEELAAVLYVSRTAISKWESGRGYPNIDSLKAISKFFGMTIDSLLSGEELLTLSSEEHKQRVSQYRNLVFSFLDISMGLLLFLPIFGQSTDGTVQNVSLPALTGLSSHMKAAYWLTAIAMFASSGMLLSIMLCPHICRIKHAHRFSLVLSIAAALLFIISRQPYAAAFCFVFLIIKAFLLFKQP